jgi:tRNA(Ile)-lysidine synthase
MNISVQPGTYVVAVSGGVDSMALLEVLRKQQGLMLIVAHFDHGIRHDSHIDRAHVQSVARQHGLPFVYHEGNLGSDASEEVARKARYNFLHAVKSASNARAIITAHHHDDVLETAVINLLRGTGRKGLSSLRTTSSIHRPLLHLPKADIKKYASDQGLVWREDETNKNTKYLRNHVRHNLLSQLTEQQKTQLSSIITAAAQTNYDLDLQLLHYLHLQPGLDRLHRQSFIRLPHNVSKEVLAAWLRRQGIADFDKRTLDRVTVQSKTLPPGKVIDVVNKSRLKVSKNQLVLEVERSV